MGHHWPGADWPENTSSDNGDDQGSDRGSRPERGPDWSGAWNHFSSVANSSGRGRRASGPPPWLGEIFGFATAPQRPQPRGPARAPR